MATRISMKHLSYLALCLLLCFSHHISRAQIDPISTFSDQTGKISQFEISDNEQYLASANNLGIIKVWDLNSKDQIFAKRHHNEEVKFIFFRSGTEQLITIGNSEIIFTNIKTGGLVSTITMFEDIEWVDLSPDGNSLFVMGMREKIEDAGAIYKVDLQTRGFEEFYSKSRVSLFKVSPDSKQMYLTKGSNMDFINIDLKIVDKEFDDHESKIRTIDLNPGDSEWMLTTDNYTTRYWQTTSGRSIPFFWTADHAFLIKDSQILTANSDSLILRDYKNPYQLDIIKIKYNGIKDVKVSDSRSLAGVLTGTNTIEIYSIGIQDNTSKEVANVAVVAAATTATIKPAASVEVASGDEDVYAKYKAEIDHDLGLKSYLFAARGEFEKSSDFEVRKAEADSYRSGVFDYYREKITRAQELERSLALAKKRYLDSLARRDEARKADLYREKIKESYKEYFTRIEQIGSYDPDTEVFPITIEGQTKNVKVPISYAPLFKQDYSDLKVVATSQLNSDAVTTETFNIKIFDKNANKFYDFGEQRKPLYVNVRQEDTLEGQLLASLTATRSTEPQTAAEVPVKIQTPDDLAKQMAGYLEERKYYALIIGVEEYADPGINTLDNPVNDAVRLKGVLNNNYNFKDENITLLKNPTRGEIIEAFDNLSQVVETEDNLLIFYAGHGIWDEKLKQGYWLPSNSKKSSKAQWLSNGTIRDYVGGIKSKHTLLIADACFSGGIFKTRDVFMESRAVLELYKLPSRKAMTSGNMKTVPDKSVFMEYLIKRLKENDQTIISAEQLFSSFRRAVINNSANGQVPQYGDIRQAGDEGGDFVFLRNN